MSETAVAEKPKRVERRYDEATIQRGLTELAACSGNARLASARLAEDEVDIPHQTLAYWRTKSQVQAYERIRNEQLPFLRRLAADQHSASAAKRMEVADELMDALKAKKDQLEPKDLSTSIRNLDVGAGIHSQNAEKLNDQPTIIERRDLSEVLREMNSMGVVIEGTAEEIKDES